MNRKSYPPASRRFESDRSRQPVRFGGAILEQRPVCPPEGESLPQVEVRIGGGLWHPFIYRKQLGQYPRNAGPGDLVELVSTSGETQGYGLFNPEAEMAIRVLRPGHNAPDEAWWDERLSQAVVLRRETLRLDEVSEAIG